MAFSETTGTNEDYEQASADQLRMFYAAKASVNTNVDPPSVPSTVGAVYADTVAQHGEHVAFMAISEYQGMLQSFLVGLLNARRVLEIGTFTGASAIFFANALKRNGVSSKSTDGHKSIVSLDISHEFAQTARQNFVRAGVNEYVDVVVGDAHESLNELVGQTFDIVFLDADKESYRAYYDKIVESKMLAKGGLIIADNTAFDWVTPFIGIPVPVAKDAVPLHVPYSSHPECLDIGQALHEFNEYVRQDPRSEVVMLPLFTGISLIRLLPDN
ncbi:hypothetical protein IWW56_003597 [Coemansia sp. RSA 2131]|nr:hypothetical protein IWW56_003597 [Coemansia sp. RSA 2131]